MNRVRPSSAKSTLERSDSAEVVSALLRVPSVPVLALSWHFTVPGTIRCPVADAQEHSARQVLTGDHP